MELIKEFHLRESEKVANKQARYAISSVNKMYNEWKKITRRVNAVDLSTTTANKLSNISPSTVPLVHEATRLKIATLIMRVLDVPPWESLERKKRLYKKLYPIIQSLKHYKPNTGTGGTLQEIIATRFSASICFSGSENGNFVFVSYEPIMPSAYLKYLFGDLVPKKTYKMKVLNLPEDFGELIDILKINLEKCEKHYNRSRSRTL